MITPDTDRPDDAPTLPSIPQSAPISAAKREKVLRDLAHAINCNSLENGSNTPDFILAKVALDAIEQFDSAVLTRASWYGRMDAVGGSIGGQVGTALSSPT